MGIHPSAVVHPTAKLGADCEIGPFAILEANVVVGDRCHIAAHAVIKQGTVLGSDNRISEHAVLGGLAQHVQLREYTGGLIVGSGNVVREYVTIHRALHEHGSTVVGDNNFIMVNAHIAHDCTVGNHVILANNCMISGHVTIGDRAFLSGSVGVHQFCRVGRQCMVGGMARIVKDVPPYVTIDGGTSLVVGLNTIGLRRSGMTSEELITLKQAYRIIYRSRLTWASVLKALAEQFPTGPAAEFHHFFANSKRGVTTERRLPPGAAVKLADADDRSGDGDAHVRAG